MKQLIIIALVITCTGCEKQFFTIPTSSMEGTLPVGSRIFVDVNATPSRYDMIVLKWPDHDVFYVSRIIGMPGQKLEISSSNIFINNKNQPDTSTVQHSYMVKTKMILNERIFKELKINEHRRISDGYFIFTSSEKAQRLRKNNMVEAVEMIIAEKKIGSMLFDDFNNRQWTVDNFGPVIIPKKGMTIKLNELNEDIYRTVIKKYEGSNTDEDTYTFQKDYVFVMGDNRHNAHDSRYLGFLPAENIHGVASKYNFW